MEDYPDFEEEFEKAAKAKKRYRTRQADYEQNTRLITNHDMATKPAIVVAKDEYYFITQFYVSADLRIFSKRRSGQPYFFSDF